MSIADNVTALREMAKAVGEIGNDSQGRRTFAQMLLDAADEIEQRRKTIEWFDPAQKLPNDGEECLLMPRDHGGMTTVGVYGPIPWSEKNKMWVDLFRTPKAGECIGPIAVGCWTLWEPIQPPDDLPRETEKT